ncbi:trypsin-2 [Cryptotermes secundus]|uniref:trypsin-2 n=1 Tax=Cryptotermes secundus TaxID=105785 RepID=UPI001454C9C8|nr:trypsin-2 [Cryptotermes secundus]
MPQDRYQERAPIFPPLVLGTTQRAVTLPTQGQKTAPGAMAVVTGWGATQEGGGASRILQKVELPIVSKDRCRGLYDDLPDHQICAGHPETGGKDSCQGDSGGPLVVSGRQVGVVSWGYGCAQPRYPGVYTEVAAYRRWITKKTGI